MPVLDQERKRAWRKNEAVGKRGVKEAETQCQGEER